MVRDVSGVIRHSISDGHYTLGWCAYMVLMLHYTLLVLLSIFYTLAVILLIRVATPIKPRKVEYLFTYKQGQGVVTHMACIFRGV